MVKCILCQNQSKKVNADVYKCLICKTHFYPKYKEVQFDYTKEYETTYPGLQEYCQNLIDPFYEVSKRGQPYAGVFNILKKANPDMSVLDVGCGYGYTTWAMRNAGLKATGIDISETSINFAKKTFGGNYFCEDIQKYAERKVKHDLVVAIEVFEHLSYPKEFIKSCMEVSNTLILTTPNLDSAYLQDWFSDKPPLHQACYRLSSMKYIAKEFKLRFHGLLGENIIAIFTK